MLHSYLKIAWRALAKYPVYSLLNVGGLALGLAAAFVLGLYVRQELTYDRAFDGGDRIYRVATDFFDMGGFAKSQQQLLDVLPQEVPAVELATRFDRGFQPTEVVVGDRVFEEERYFFVDSTFFRMFSYRFLAGNAATAMQAPGEAVLSERLAKAYFGDEPALGQTILVGREKEAYRVTGVVRPPGGKTHLAADLWLPLETRAPAAAWTNVTYYNYVRLRPGATAADLERGLEALRRRHAYPAAAPGMPYEAWATSPHAVRFWVQPLADIHLRSDYRFEIAPGGDATTVYVLDLIAGFILLIAGLNYVNLTTARSAVRAREVGVKKTLGAPRGALVRQFLAETIVASLLATVAAAGLAEVMLGVFASVTGTELVGSVFGDPRHAVGLVGFAVLVGVLAGLYPAFYLARFRPVQILKGTWAPQGGQRLRGGLVVVQFTIAIALVICSLVVHEQLAYMRDTDKGFAHEGVVVVENAGVLGGRAEAFRRRLEAEPQVVRSSFARRVPTGPGVWMYTYQTPEMDQAVTIQTFPGDADYLPTLGMRLVAGRNFSRDLASDSSAVILNEAAARVLGLGEAPLGREVGPGQHVIGVVSDFHFQSLRQAIEPVVLAYDPGGGQLILRLDGRGSRDFVDRMEAAWRSFEPGEPIRYAFVDDNFARLADQERLLGRAVSFFTVLALLIAAMGMFGLTAFAVQRRTKEIGVRKVLGASVPGLVALLSKDFLRLVLVAFVLASPVAYLVMQEWLAHFAYRIAPSWTVFTAAGLVALVVALGAVSYQALRAALADPVESLRYE